MIIRYGVNSVINTSVPKGSDDLVCQVRFYHEKVDDSCKFRAFSCFAVRLYPDNSLACEIGVLRLITCSLMIISVEEGARAEMLEATLNTLVVD